MTSFFCERGVIISIIIVLASLSQTHANDENDQGHNACGTTSTCLGLSHENMRTLKTCKNGERCDAFVEIVPPNEAENRFRFNLRVDHGSPIDYVGVGFSKEDKMNKMLILQCLREKESKQVYAHVSWNSEQSKPSPTPIYGGTIPTKMPEGVSMAGTLRGKISECNFFLPDTLLLPNPGPGYSIRFTDGNYRVSVAMGVADGPKMKQHSGVGQGGPIDLKKIQTKVTLEPHILRKLHAFLMVIAYCTLIPTATTMARFFRETWATHQIFKKRIWFTIHVTLLYGALICTVMSYIFIGIDVGKVFPREDEDSSSWIHALIGIFSIVLLLSQTIIPWAIPNRQILVKRTYSLIHAIVGSTCYFLGLLNIMLAPYLMPKFANCSIILVVFIWIGFHFCCYWVFVTHQVIKDHEMINNNSRFRAIIALPMRLKTMDEAPGSKTRMVFFGIFLVLSLSITIIMATQIFQDTTECKIYFKHPP